MLTSQTFFFTAPYTQVPWKTPSQPYRYIFVFEPYFERISVSSVIFHFKLKIPPLSAIRSKWEQELYSNLSDDIWDLVLSDIYSSSSRACHAF